MVQSKVTWSASLDNRKVWWTGENLCRILETIDEVCILFYHFLGCHWMFSRVQITDLDPLDSRGGHYSETGFYEKHWIELFLSWEGTETVWKGMSSLPRSYNILQEYSCFFLLTLLISNNYTLSKPHILRK